MFRGGLAFALLLALEAASSASPLELFGFGGRTCGLAGTGIASTDGYESVYLDPAGLARVSRKRATVGFLLGDFSLEMNGEGTDTDRAKGLVIGGELPLPFGGAWKDRVGLGFGFYIPGKAINRASEPFPGTPIFILLEHRSHVIALQVAAGAKITDELDLGIGVITLAALGGAIAVSTDSAGRFTTNSEQELLTKFAPVIGARYHLRDGLELGAALRWESRSDYDIQVTTDIGDVVPIQLPPIQIAGTAQYDPLTIAAEAAWRPRPDLLLSGQLQWQHWSAFPLPTLSPTAESTPQELPDFHDTVVPRVSAELTIPHGATVIAARTGAAFAMSPAPEETGQQSFLDNHRLIAAAGLGVSRAAVHLDLWVQLHQLVGRQHEKDGGVFEPPGGVPSAVIDTGGRVVAGGLTVGLDL